MKSEPGPPMTLGGAAAAQLRFIFWCKDCQHQVEPDPAEMAQLYGSARTVPRLTRAAGVLHVREPADRDGCHRQ
jgi:hypothetical protein